MLYICMDNSSDHSYLINYNKCIASKVIYWSYIVYSKYSQFGSLYLTVMGAGGG